MESESQPNPPDRQSSVDTEPADRQQLSLLELPIEVLESIFLHFDQAQRIRIACCVSKRLLHTLNTSHRLWESVKAELETAVAAERFTAWLAGKQHLVRELTLTTGSDNEEEEEEVELLEEGEEARPKPWPGGCELARHSLFILGMLAGGPLSSLSWTLKGRFALKSWMLRLPHLECLRLTCTSDTEDAPVNVTLSRELSRLTALTELVVGHGAVDADIANAVLPTSLHTLALSPVAASLPEAVTAATHLRKLCISNIDQLMDAPPGPELYGLDAMSCLTSLALNFCLLNTLPEEMAALVLLEELSIANTTFQGPDPMLQRLTGLTRLSKLLASECELTSVPSELWEMPNLRSLDLGFNPLVELSFGAEAGQQLQQLCLSPAVAALNAGTLAQLSALPNLYLRGAIPELEARVESLEYLLDVLGGELRGLTLLSFAECFAGQMSRSVGLFLKFVEMTRRRPELQLVDEDIPAIGYFLGGS